MNPGTRRLPPQASATEGRAISALVFESIGLCAEDAGADSPTEEEWKAQIDARDLQIKTQAAALITQLEEVRCTTRSETQTELDRAFTERLAAERVAITQLTEQFAQERSRYFAAVEVEVVKLSLAIAARILHREAKMDPLMLAGAVRVALEKIQGKGETFLHVPESDLAVWRERFSIGSTALTIVPDPQIETGTCVLETPVGSVNFGVEVQLAEIERGFFDLLQHRPV